MKGVYILAALAALGAAVWIFILTVNGVRSWLRKREEKRLEEREADRRYLRGGSAGGPDGL